MEKRRFVRVLEQISKLLTKFTASLFNIFTPIVESCMNCYHQISNDIYGSEFYPDVPCEYLQLPLKKFFEIRLPAWSPE